MSLRIQGIGWVTPLGRNLVTVQDAVAGGVTPSPARLENPFNHRAFPIFRVDPASVADIARIPRLRRSSAISLFAVAAAMDALHDAGDPPTGDRMAVVFAATNGGVIYTRRFFEEVSKTGTQAGSPLLFPETVYNAPASHVAAALGITGITTTLVNDATVGIDAISVAGELLESGAYDRCLVLASEEADWVICEGYRSWRLTADEPPAVPFSGRGAIFGEGAAALLLAPQGDGPAVERIQCGTPFQSIADARERLTLFGKRDPSQILASCTSGTSFDEAEGGLQAIATRIAPKVALGESFAVSTLTQVACAALALRKSATGTHALVPAVGFQGHVAALTLRA